MKARAACRWAASSPASHFAINYKQTNFLLNDAVSANGAKIIFNQRSAASGCRRSHRSSRSTATRIPIVVNGRIVWMVDGYTTMANYPYSEQQSLSSLTTDSLTTTNRTATQPNSDINYIRNSVKATVDAYDGTSRSTTWDEQRPGAQGVDEGLPGPGPAASPLCRSLRDHVRYPEDLFEVQRALLASTTSTTR